MLTPIPPSRVLHEWGAISADIVNARTADDPYSLSDVLAMLETGEMQAWRVSGDGAGHVVTWYGQIIDTELPGLWVMYAAGKLFGGPKRRLSTMRGLIACIEDFARHLECTEVRVEDRATWRVALRDYDTSIKPDGGIILRKVL